VLSNAIGEHVLVEIEIAGANELAIIQEVQHEPISGAILHVDFHAVKADEKLRSSIVVEPVGESIGVKSFGGLLEQSLRELEVECFPKDLPEVIRVDISALNIGDSVHVRDITLPEGVEAITDADLTVFLVASPTVAAEPVPGAETPTQPEVIREKKEEAAAS
jgi:large subunit ribosomal protein L25